MTLKEKAKELRNNVTVLFMALNKKETPWYAKIVAGITVGYALSPIDLIPDFIPLLGYLDDIIILPLLVTISIKIIPKQIMEKCKVEAEGIWNDGKPKRWYYAIPIVVFWIIIVVIIFDENKR
ncbi:MAG: YkvA family protein [Clostridiaceae bacterium]